MARRVGVPEVVEAPKPSPPPKKPQEVKPPVEKQEPKPTK